MKLFTSAKMVLFAVLLASVDSERIKRRPNALSRIWKPLKASWNASWKHAKGIWEPSKGADLSPSSDVGSKVEVHSASDVPLPKMPWNPILEKYVDLHPEQDADKKSFPFQYGHTAIGGNESSLKTLVELTVDILNKGDHPVVQRVRQILDKMDFASMSYLDFEELPQVLSREMDFLNMSMWDRSLVQASMNHYVGKHDGRLSLLLSAFAGNPAGRHHMVDTWVRRHALGFDQFGFSEHGDIIWHFHIWWQDTSEVDFELKRESWHSHAFVMGSHVVAGPVCQDVGEEVWSKTWNEGYPTQEALVKKLHEDGVLEGDEELVVDVKKKQLTFGKKFSRLNTDRANTFLTGWTAVKMLEHTQYIRSGETYVFPKRMMHRVVQCPGVTTGAVTLMSLSGFDRFAIQRYLPDSRPRNYSPKFSAEEVGLKLTWFANFVCPTACDDPLMQDADCRRRLATMEECSYSRLGPVRHPVDAYRRVQTILENYAKPLRLSTVPQLWKETYGEDLLPEELLATFVKMLPIFPLQPGKAIQLVDMTLRLTSAWTNMDTIIIVGDVASANCRLPFNFLPAVMSLAEQSNAPLLLGLGTTTDPGGDREQETKLMNQFLLAKPGTQIKREVRGLQTVAARFVMTSELLDPALVRESPEKFLEALSSVQSSEVYLGTNGDMTGALFSRSERVCMLWLSSELAVANGYASALNTTEATSEIAAQAQKQWDMIEATVANANANGQVLVVGMHRPPCLASCTEEKHTGPASWNWPEIVREKLQKVFAGHSGSVHVFSMPPKTETNLEGPGASWDFCERCHLWFVPRSIGKPDDITVDALKVEFNVQGDLPTLHATVKKVTVESSSTMEEGASWRGGESTSCKVEQEMSVPSVFSSLLSASGAALTFVIGELKKRAAW